MPDPRIIVFAVALASVSFFIVKLIGQNKALSRIIERLSADSRIAQVLVTDVDVNPRTQKARTTIKFLEYDTEGKALAPKYFSFTGSVIQFQSLVIRFDDLYIKQGHPLKGKSAYLFMKVFSLTDNGAESFDINKVNEVPSGYRLKARMSGFERRLWREFWEYALRPGEAKQMGIKNAQIEAPGTRFVPGLLYTIKIEHDGGMRIDAQCLPQILKGEKFVF